MFLVASLQENRICGHFSNNDYLLNHFPHFWTSVSFCTRNNLVPMMNHDLAFEHNEHGNYTHSTNTARNSTEALII